MKNSVESSLLAVTYMVKGGKIVLVKKVAPGVVSILSAVSAAIAK